MLNFNTFAFNPPIQAGIRAAGYSTPTPIQHQTIPAILDGRDVLGLAQTGTGKTAAFVLPILQRLLSGRPNKARALILAPTRELAEQTHMAIRRLGEKTGLRSVTMYGGVSPQPQIRALRAGAEIIVACPGRLLDLMNQKLVYLGGIEVVVLDEADRMFDMGFLPDIRRIMAALPNQRQTLLFSATMPPEIRKLADEFLHHPVTVEIDTERPVDTIKQTICSVAPDRKYEALMELLPEAGNGQVLIFTRTKHRAKKLSMLLSNAGISTTSLQGNLSQGQRQLAMDGFRSGRVKVMVATDIAARGLDVAKISHVINYDMPDTSDAYTHRIGRTGRMRSVGAAISLVTREDMPMLRAIEKMLGHRLERHPVTEIQNA
ncbi:MAG TPA: DEAD/DEAH box helicase [Anaerolineaceae bacterium]|jgi:ATP-dependent RNA helicase RhlE|nr:DEAD/DEAH box helicase [Anaerolineaceae bacterium]HNS36545.1 DEAD/DEAH box helicase [Anaerolineaceae bacterium]HOG79127.1 DEAD/DEAH box helicase [Anaerolineaceae bacterium]HQF62150.1 DEAD/DEAH box helicase [Anaerolineaceae bacterium]HQH84836.1 DEAD/DEAH box helicase [Anaerolineaceae bacterium]